MRLIIKIMKGGKQATKKETLEVHRHACKRRLFCVNGEFSAEHMASAFITHITSFSAVTQFAMHVTLLLCFTKSVYEVQSHEEIELRQL